MKEDLIADIWSLFVSEISTKSRPMFATDYINLLADNGVTDAKLKSAMGVDPHLDEAISSFLEDDIDVDQYYNDEDDSDDDDF